MPSFKDYYAIMGMERGSFNASFLRKRFRILAKEYHPDVNKEPDIAEKMKDITEAYTVLKDPEKKIAYDRIYDQRQTELRAERAARSWAEGQKMPGGAWQRREAPPRRSDDWFNIFRKTWDLDGIFGGGILGVWDTEGKSYQDLERERQERSRQEREVRKAKALGERIRIPEDDVYLMAAMIKLLRDKSLQKAEVRDETDRLIWEVRPPQPLVGWVVRRTISDWVDTRVWPKIDLGWKGKRSPTELFEIDDIDFLSMRGVPQIPKFAKDYVRCLENIAERLAEPGMPRVSESLISEAWGIKFYLKENEKLFPGTRMREALVGRIGEGLDESRIRFFRGTHEGKPRVV